MKTVEEFIREVRVSDALINELKAASNMDEITDILRKNDVDGTAEDLIKAFQSEAEAGGEITDDDAEAAAGGMSIIDDNKDNPNTIRPVIPSDTQFISAGTTPGGFSPSAIFEKFLPQTKIRR